MRASILLLALAVPTVVGCGPETTFDAAEVIAQDGDDVAADGVLKSTDPMYFEVRRDTRKCGYPLCGGVFVTPLQRKSIYCADGKRAATCYLPELDTSETSLTPALEAALQDDLRRADRTVILLGQLRKAPKTGGEASFGVLRAFRADGLLEEPAGLTWWRATTQEQPCEFQPCRTLSLRKLNSTTKKTIHGLELDGALSLATRDATLLAAYSEPGLLFAGTTRTVRNGAERLTYAAPRFLLAKYRASDGERVCGENLEELILRASTGLLQMSETDAPFSYVAREESVSRLSIARFRSLFAIADDAAVTTSTLDRFFAGSTRDDEDLSPAGQASAAQFRHLRALLETQLTGLEVYRVGEVSIDVYVIGRNACGQVAGVKTFVVET